MGAENKRSDRYLQRARAELGIITRKTKEFPPKRIWSLPGHDNDEPDSESVQEKLELQTD